MTREAELLAKNINLIPNLKTNNQNNIDRELIKIVGTKFKSNPLHWIAIYNNSGNLIYFSEDLNIANNFLPRKIIIELFSNYQTYPSGIFEDTYKRYSVIGGDFLVQDNKPKFLILNGFYMPNLINEMSLASRDKISLLDLKSNIIYKTYTTPHPHFETLNYLGYKSFEILKLDGKIFHIYSWPLKLNNQKIFGQIFLLSDWSEFHQQTKRALYLSITIGVLITFIIICVLFVILKNAILPLSNALKILKALIKGDPNIAAIEYNRDDEIGAIANATEDLRQKTIQLHKLEEQKKDLIKIREQLNIARSIQSSIVTDEPLHGEKFDIAGFMRAATEVGGDFYDYFKTKNDELVLIIGDVSGKGVPAAMFMAMTISYLKAHLKADLPISEALKRTNNLLIEKNAHQFFVTVFACKINLRNNIMTFSNAGHNLPIIMDKKNNVELLKATGDMALGVLPNITYSEKTHKLCPRESLFLYTDGLTEASNIKQNQYGEKRLIEQFKAGFHLTPACHLEYIINDIDQFSESMDQFDDMTAVIFTIHSDSLVDLSLTVPLNINKAIQSLSYFFQRRKAFFKPFQHKLTHIEMVIEELIVNVIKYGANQVKYQNELIRLNFKIYKSNTLIITLKDQTPSFNPLKIDSPDLDEHIAARKIGGLGIHLTRELTDEFTYLFENGSNKITIAFKK